MFFVIIFLISRKIPGYALRITPQAIFFARVSANDRRGAQMEFSYEFLIKRLKAFYSAAGLRPLPLKNEVNPFLTAAQAVCRETAFIK